MGVISRIDLGVLVMNRKQQSENERLYLGTMVVANDLRKQGVISDEEYRQIDTIFREKYEPTLSTLFTDIDLIKLETYGNM